MRRKLSVVVVLAVAAGNGFAYADPAVPAAVAAPDSRANCLRETGSHLPPASGKCLNGEGNSYSRERIESTGAINLGDALQTVDPSVDIHRH